MGYKVAEMAVYKAFIRNAHDSAVLDGFQGPFITWPVFEEFDNEYAKNLRL